MSPEEMKKRQLLKKERAEDNVKGSGKKCREELRMKDVLLILTHLKKGIKDEDLVLSGDGGKDREVMV